MGNHDYEHEQEPELARDELDDALDAALAKYAAVEPRVGLEERVLANLRAEQAKAPERGWWPWSVAAGLAAVIAVAVTLTWRSSNPPRPVIAGRPLAATPVTKESGTQIPGTIGNPTNARRPTSSALGHRPHSLVVASAPKLDVFPSPEPLSPEELALAQYVRNFPADAKVVAEAQADSEKELQARMQALANESAESN